MKNIKKLSAFMSAVMLCSAAANSGAAVFAEDTDSTVAAVNKSVSYINLYEDKDAMIDFCENTKIACSDGKVIFGCISSDEKPEYEYFYNKNGKVLVDCNWTYTDLNLQMSYKNADGKTYYIFSCDDINDGIFILNNKANEAVTAYKITENGNKAEEISINAAERIICDIPDCMPVGFDEFVDFCKNKKIAVGNGMVIFGFEAASDKVNIDSFTVETNGTEKPVVKETGFMFTDDNKYILLNCKYLNDGIVVIKNKDTEKKYYYEISENGNKAEEISIYAAERILKNIPDCVPFGPEEYVDFCVNKKAAAGDGLVVFGFITESEKITNDSFIISKNGEEKSAIEKMGFSYYDDTANAGKQYCILKCKYLNDGIVVIKSSDTEEEYSFEISDNGKTIKEITASEDYEPGDIDGSGVTELTDLSYLSVFLLGDCEFTPAQMLAADVTGDGEVDIRDLATLKQFICKDPDVVLKKYTK